MSTLWTAQALCDATRGQMTGDAGVSGISIDTRTIQPGDLFVALVGENGDGHAHVAEALARGASAAMVHHRAGLPEGAPLLMVRDTLQGLRDLGAAGRARFTGRAVAVTGSVGKTSTKEMLRAILSVSGTTHAAEASYNNHWGVPLTLARLPGHAAFLVSEIGMNHAGEIAPLAALVRPHVAMVVSVEAAHIGHLGSLGAIADEKASILSGLEPGGTAVLPGDHALFARLLAQAGGARVLRFGAGGGTGDLDAVLIDCGGDADGSDITARIAGETIRFRLGAPGRHMAMNAVAALAAAGALGADWRGGAAALAAFRPVIGRGLRLPVLNGQAVLLDESYNASGAAIRAALQVLKLIPARRRIAVLGDMREMGDFGPAGHAALADAVAASADVLHTCGPLMRHLHEAVPAPLRGLHEAESAALAPRVAALLQPGDAVLVKGSLGSRMKLVVQAIDALDAPAGRIGSAA